MLCYTHMLCDAVRCGAVRCGAVRCQDPIVFHGGIELGWRNGDLLHTANDSHYGAKCIDEDEPGPGAQVMGSPSQSNVTSTVCAPRRRTSAPRWPCRHAPSSRLHASTARR